MMKVAFTGPRDLDLTKTDIALAIYQSGFDVYHIIAGDAKGVDRAVREYASIYYIYDWEEHKAAWDMYGKAAGPYRNRSMIKRADALIAFVRDDKRPVTAGTASTIAEAVVKDIPIYIMKIREEKTRGT